MDVTPLVPQERQIVEAYGDGGFRVSGTRYEGSVIVTPERTLAWAATSMADITAESLAPVSELGLQVLLLGCGPSMALVPADLRRELRAQGVVIEPMDTGAAARTFNVLMTEARSAAAALIAVA